MNYKVLIPNRSIRLKLLSFMSFIPDRIMITFQYLLKTHRFINWSNPKRYTEKLQWLKVYYRDPLMIRCTDKYDVRSYIKQCGLESILTTCYGVYNNVDEIDFNNLPNEFVLKDTLGGGGNSVILVNNKELLDFNKIRSTLHSWTSENHTIRSAGREWPYYSGNKHRIIIEELLPSNKTEGGLVDYKFLCFNGKPVLLYILTNRIPGKEAECGIFDIRFKKLNVIENDEKILEHNVMMPNNYEKMLLIAEQLSKPFPCSRIDLYNINGKIYFGEITFFDSSGYMLFKPDGFDLFLGSLLTLPQRI